MELTPLQQYVLIDQLKNDINNRVNSFINYLEEAHNKGVKIDPDIYLFIKDILAIAIEHDTRVFCRMLFYESDLKEICSVAHYRKNLEQLEPI